MEQKLSPGQIAYRKALARKGMGLGGVPLAQPQPEVTQAKAAALRKAAKAALPVAQAAVPTVVATCALCGKPLTRPSSVAQGHGDICETKLKLLPAGVSMSDHYALLQEVEVPPGFILLKDAIRSARAKGCSGYRFIQACGGDRMLRPPLNPNFKVVFVFGKRYVSAKALQDLACLKKV